MNRFRRTGPGLALATLLALALALAPAGAPAAERDPQPRHVATCGTVAEAAGLAHGTRAEILRTAGVPCAKARSVVRRCIDGTLGRRWLATSPEAATLLTKGRTRVAFHVLAGEVPGCIRKAQRIEGVAAADLTLHQALAPGAFGPFEGPNSYPDRLPPPFKIAYEWTSPVATNAASIPDGSVSTVSLLALVRNRAGEARGAWFEYGTTRDVRQRTDDQTVPVNPDDSPARMAVTLSHLRAGTRYWWRAAASFDAPAGGSETRYGVLGSFVTNPYPKISDPSRPCQSQPASLASLFELSESLAIACATRQFAKGACFPACNTLYNGNLKCDRAFPRNLNAGSWSFPVPKLGIPITVDELASYWRSNDSNRFWTLPGKNKNSSGGDVGPVPGWHDWDVAQWAYPDRSTSTTVDFWINCTEKWGGVMDGSALAAGDGTDRASPAAPATPQQLTARATADGGVDVSWQPSSPDLPARLAGYTLIVTGWRPGEPRVFGPTLITPITTTGTSGRVSAANLAIARKSGGGIYDVYIAVAAVSGEGRVSVPATVRWPPA